MPQYAVSFVLPAGWTGVLPPDAEHFVMRTQAYQAYILAGIEEMTVSEAQHLMSENIDLGDGIVLRPAGEVRVETSVLTADYSITGSRVPLVGQVTAIIGDHGYGIYFIAASEPGDSGRVREVVGAIRASLVLRDPTSRIAEEPAREGGVWAQRLSGRKLSHFFTRSGYTEEDYIWLCPGGHFFRSLNSGGFGGGASGAFQSRNGGRWEASGNADGGVLILAFNDGRTARLALSLQGERLFLDGKRYFREAADCR